MKISPFQSGMIIHSKCRAFPTVRMCAARGRVIILSVGRSVCYPMHLRTRDRVITLSVHLFVDMFVCLFYQHKNRHFERNRLVYGLLRFMIVTCDCVISI